MKKILLVAAIFAVASINSFGAACVGTTLNLLVGVSCTVGSANQWTLSNFGVIGTSTQTNYGTALTASDLQITFANVGTSGFSVSFSDAAGGLNFFNVANPSGSASDQAAEWRTQIRVVGTTGSGSSIVGINQSAQGFFGDASMTINKRMHDAAAVLTQAVSVCQGCGSPTSSAWIFGAFGNDMFANDVVNFNALGGASLTSGLTSYTNTFMAAEPVPEPITFVLMGAGLVGIAALRRRKS